MTHLSARQLATLELDGLPATKSGINMRAAAEGWSFVDRPGRGGGRLYAAADLPVLARRDLAARWAAATATTLRPAGRPKGSDFFTLNPDVAAAVEVILAEQKRSIPIVRKMLATSYDALPSRRTLARFVARLEAEKVALLASTRDPDAFKSKFRLSLGRADGGLTHAHQRWELDTTQADVLTKGGRRAILGVIDGWSRRARFLVVPSESAQSVRRLLVDTIRTWGVMPDTVATDQGSGFINASIGSALEALGIEHKPCPPGSPEKKPFVERLFGTFTRDRAELLEGYAGHNVAEAQQLRAKARKEGGRAVIVPHLDPDELQAIISNWTEGEYHQRRHSSLGVSPMAKWLSSPVKPAAAPSEDVLKIALSAFVGVNTVGKRGVQWKGDRYWAPGLAAFVGRQVVVRRDEDDLGALFVFDEAGRFIDTAVNHERSGLSQEAFAREGRRDQAKLMNAQRAELRQKKRDFSIADAKAAILRQDAERAAAVAAFPVATERRTTLTIDSIAHGPQPALPSAARLDEAMARTAPRRAAPSLSPAEKVAAADRVLAAEARGEDVDAAELGRARLYATSSEYRTEKLLSGAFASPATAAPAATYHRRTA